MLTEVKSTDQPLSPGAWGEWKTTRDLGSQGLSAGTTIAVLQQHLWLVLGDDVYRRFTWVNPSTRSWFPTTLMLAEQQVLSAHHQTAAQLHRRPRVVPERHRSTAGAAGGTFKPAKTRMRPHSAEPAGSACLGATTGPSPTDAPLKPAVSACRAPTTCVTPKHPASAGAVIERTTSRGRC